MSSPFVQFPGTSGNYVFTADVNLLDADTAHCYQSIGGWKANANVAVTATPQTPPVAPPFGSTAVKATAATATPVMETGRTAGKPTIDVSASTEYTASVWVYTDAVGIGDARMRIYDSTGGALGGSTLGDETPLVAGAWTQVQATRTTAAGVDGLLLLLYLADGDASASDVFYVAANSVREGSDGTFVPSLRIVGDLDLRAKAAADDWTSGNRALMSNYNGDGFVLYHDGSGYLHFESGGATSAIDESSALYTFVDGQTAEVRVTLDVSAGNLVWYQSGVQVDTDTFTAQALDPGTNQLSVAADYLGTGLLFAGDIYYCEVRDGIAGPVVARFDAADVLAAL